MDGEHLTLDLLALPRVDVADAGRRLGYVRVVGRRKTEAPLYEPILSVPAQYAKKPLLRGSE